MESKEVLQINYLQGRNRGFVIKNGRVDPERGMSWETGTDIYTQPCVRQIACGKVLYSTGAQLCAL